MTIEERLEALTQTVELLGGMQVETEKKLQRLIDTVNRVALLVVDHDERLDDLEGNQAQ